MTAFIQVFQKGNIFQSSKKSDCIKNKIFIKIIFKRTLFYFFIVKKSLNYLDLLSSIAKEYILIFAKDSKEERNNSRIIINNLFWSFYVSDNNNNFIIIYKKILIKNYKLIYNTSI